MSIPIICLDARLRQFCEKFRKCFSQPQFKYLVTVVLADLLIRSILREEIEFLRVTKSALAAIQG
jgi:hypothetical protein